MQKKSFNAAKVFASVCVPDRFWFPACLPSGAAVDRLVKQNLLGPVVHAGVSLGKTLNPMLLSMGLAEPCIAAAVQCLRN